MTLKIHVLLTMSKMVDGIELEYAWNNVGVYFEVSYVSCAVFYIAALM
jgi:hypothetical protein